MKKKKVFLVLVVVAGERWRGYVYVWIINLNIDNDTFYRHLRTCWRIGFRNQLTKVYQNMLHTKNNIEITKRGKNKINKKERIKKEEQNIVKCKREQEDELYEIKSA